MFPFRYILTENEMRILSLQSLKNECKKSEIFLLLLIATRLVRCVGQQKAII
jgi:hypothetical protein